MKSFTAFAINLSRALRPATSGRKGLNNGNKSHGSDAVATRGCAARTRCTSVDPLRGADRMKTGRIAMDQGTSYGRRCILPAHAVAGAEWSATSLPLGDGHLRFAPYFSPEDPRACSTR